MTTHPPAIHSHEVSRYAAGAFAAVRDEVAAEEPLEIRVEGKSVAVVMRTPGNDRELAAGFLLSEGIIRSARDLFDVTTCVAAGAIGKGNAVDVALAQPGAFDSTRFSRHVVTTASCGICGTASMEGILKRQKPTQSEAAVSAELLLSLPARLAKKQKTFQRTGGLHACALFNLEGELMELREDVGRHNALDKLIGWAVLERKLPLEDHLVLLSGRVSFEMMQKAHAAAIPIVAAISAPTSLAVEFARESGQTLAAFLRGQNFNVYSGPQRVTEAPRNGRRPSRARTAKAGKT